MTLSVSTPKLQRNAKMAENTFRSLVGKRMTKNVKFLGTDVTISKLSVSQVLEIQAKAKNTTEDEANAIDLLRTVIRLSVTGAEDISDEEFAEFPLEEISRLANDIMKYSGMNNEQQGK